MITTITKKGIPAAVTITERVIPAAATITERVIPAAAITTERDVATNSPPGARIVRKINLSFYMDCAIIVHVVKFR